jgi:hemerythrin-like domain-containing protein
MTKVSLKIISEEHRALSAMLQSLVLMAKRTHKETTANDFEVMRAILFYITEFPERLHHHKETEILFPMITKRTSEMKDVIDKLNAQHAQGEVAVHSLMNNLIAWEMMGQARQAQFLESVERYVDFYLDHMSVEANEVIPLAKKVLSEEDWKVLDAAFIDNQDPLTGAKPTKEYERLFTQVLSNAPNPIGLGCITDD